MSTPEIYANLSVPARAADAARVGAQGVGLMRAEFLVYQTGRHPRLLIDDPAPRDLRTILAAAMRTVAEAMQPRPVTYRCLDLRSNELARLEGGDRFEVVEENPALGCRGVARSRRDSDVFEVELAAFHAVRSEGFENLRFMVPFVRWPEEIAWARERLEATAPPGVPPAELWMMVETPAAVLRASEMALYVDGVSIGSNDLAQLVVAIDRDNHAFADVDLDADEAVLAMLRMAVERYRHLGVPVGVCGDAPSRSETLFRHLCDWGASSISVSLDRLERARGQAEPESERAARLT